MRGPADATLTQEQEVGRCKLKSVLNSVLGLVSKIWYRIWFDQSELST